MMARQSVRLRDNLPVRPENLKQLPQMIQLTQLQSDARQPVMAVLIDEAMHANQPVSQTLIQRMIQAHRQRPTACTRQCKRNQNQRARVPKRQPKPE
jgi:hypothetical protein